MNSRVLRWPCIRPAGVVETLWVVVFSCVHIWVESLSTVGLDKEELAVVSPTVVVALEVAGPAPMMGGPRSLRLPGIRGVT